MNHQAFNIGVILLLITSLAVADALDPPVANTECVSFNIP